ncbi:MAG: hydantoinase B/oxoprolinase family protein, partial [Rhodobacteraceae bacterium]|nr:hydantoinase B/oxoprolinase family protein [Paracoccaceae bacterium]
YTLHCFGGAGGQHACLVADALGMERIFLHPFAGVLSAYGMGLADIRALRECQHEAALDSAGAEAALAVIRAEALAEVADQGVARADIRTEARAHLRYDGSHQTLEVAFGPAAGMRAAFEAAHQARFGFTSPDRAILFDMLAAEAIGTAGDLPVETAPVGGGACPVGQTRFWSGGHCHQVPVHDRATLGAGVRIGGPAILTEATGTTIVEPGWEASVDPRGNLILSRTEPAARPAASGTDVDPARLEVMSNLFMSIADQMGATLANTAWSVNIKERFDFSCAIFDAQGDLVANAPHVPVHLGSMSDSVRSVIARTKGSLRPGSAYMMNSPYAGGTHLPDVTVITPVFVAGQARFWLGSRGHHADIGGRTPGSSPPDSRHISEEGVLIDLFPLVE